MTKFLYKITIFSLIFFVIDKAFLLVEKKLPSWQADRRLEKLLEKEIAADLIVLGSSRGAADIIAGQMDAVINKSCYNLCYKGSDIIFHEFLFEKVTQLQQNKPKWVALVLDDPSELLPSTNLKFREDKLYPLIGYPSIKEELVARGKKTALIVDWFVSYRIRESIPQNLKQAYSKTLMPCGSEPIDEPSKGLDTIEFDAKLDEYEPSKELKAKKEALHSILDMAKKHQIQLLFVFPPNYYGQNKIFAKRMRALIGEEALFYNYNTDNEVYSTAKYYYDGAHLNRSGAKIFTQELAAYIKAEVVF